MRIVSSIVRKKFINEMDLLRLQKALLMARMAADSTYESHNQARACLAEDDRPGIKPAFENQPKVKNPPKKNPGKANLPPPSTQSSR